MITIIGTANNDILIGSLESDLIRGRKGNDFIRGKKGNDILKGQAGNDTLVGNLGKDTLIGGNGNDSLVGGADKDSLIGGNGNDNLDGGRGKDTIDGGAGNDNLIGGKGEDVFVLRRGEGLDELIDFTPGEDKILLADGLTAEDIVIDGDGLSFVTIRDFGGEIPRTLAQIATLFDPEQFSRDDIIVENSNNPNVIIGTDGDDSLVGSLNNDTLDGGAGNDTLDGRAGFDVFTGGEGADVFIISDDGNANDILDFVDGVDKLQLPERVSFEELIIRNESNGSVSITFPSLPNDIDNSGGFIELRSISNVDLINEDDFIGLSESNVIMGTDGDDSLVGSDAPETIEGGAGNDTIDGISGGDVLVGGSGQDIFVVRRGGGEPEIADFKLGEDKILVDGVTSRDNIVFSFLGGADGNFQSVEFLDLSDGVENEFLARITSLDEPTPAISQKDLIFPGEESSDNFTSANSNADSIVL